MQIRARYAQDVGYRLHRSSPGNKGERAIHFFARPYSTAPRRIFTSIVFLPKRRWSSAPQNMGLEEPITELIPAMLTTFLESDRGFNQARERATRGRGQ